MEVGVHCTYFEQQKVIHFILKFQICQIPAFQRGTRGLCWLKGCKSLARQTLWVIVMSNLRFLYNRLALVIHCNSHLSSRILPLQLLSVIKVVLVYQIMPMYT